MKSQHNSVLHAFFVPDWSEMCGVVSVSTVLLLPTQYIAGEIVKMWCQEFDIYLLANIYIYICIYRYITRSVSDMDFLYQFNLRLHHFWGFFFNVKKNVFQKLAGLWLVGEVVNHVGFYESKVAEDCSAFQRRSCCVCRDSNIWFNIRHCDRKVVRMWCRGKLDRLILQLQLQNSLFDIIKDKYNCIATIHDLFRIQT